MRLPTLAPWNWPRDWDEQRRRRATSLALVIAIHILLLLMLLRLAPPFAPLAPPPAPLKIFQVPPPQADTHDAHHSTKGAKSKPGGARPKAQPTPAKAPPTPNAAPWVLHPELQAFNLTQVPTQAPASPSTATAASDGTGSGAQAGDSEGAGTGPGGEKLYRVDWYRHPSNAELDTYLPKTRNLEGWGEVACKTIERFHVDDCVEIGQSPPGSGLSRAVREAAWQFLVRPPRIGGKSLVGTWVRIRIDYKLDSSPAP